MGYAFVNLYQRVLADFTTRPQKITFRIDLRNMHLDGDKNFLLPGELMSTAQVFETEKKEAPDNDGQLFRVSEVLDFDVGAITYDLVREVYLWFGLDETAIPYTKDFDGIRIIDAEAIKKNG